MSTELVRRDANLTSLNIGEMQTVAGSLAESGLFDRKTAAQVFVAVLAGQELGIPPFAAVKGVHVIQGKPEVGAEVLAALVKRSGRYDYRIAEHTNQVCRLAFFEHGDHVGDSTFTIKDAETAGLLRNQTWKSYPRNMLWARAMSNAVAWFAPDLTHGRVYVDGEIPDDQASVGVVSHETERGSSTPGTREDGSVDAIQGPPQGGMVASAETIIDVQEEEAVTGGLVVTGGMLVKAQIDALGKDERKRLRAYVAAMGVTWRVETIANTWPGKPMEELLSRWDAEYLADRWVGGDAPDFDAVGTTPPEFAATAGDELAAAMTERFDAVPAYGDDA